MTRLGMLYYEGVDNGLGCDLSGDLRVVFESHIHSLAILD